MKKKQNEPTITPIIKEDSNISFIIKGKEILRLCENGDIYINRELAENNKEVVNGMAEFLVKAQEIYNKKTITT